MNILVTGAFGNIGTMLLDMLIERGHIVTALDQHVERVEEATWAMVDDQDGNIGGLILYDA